MVRLVVALVVLCAAPAARAGDAVTTSLGEASLDWTAGEISARGASVADLFAPTRAIARIGAERRARARAVALLKKAVRELRFADGGTVGAAMKRDEALAARVTAALEAARDRQIERASDGSAVVVVAAPLEALRAARDGAASEAGAADAPTALLLEATAELTPALGLTLRAAGEKYAGPVIYVRDGEAAARDPRLGPRVVRGKLGAAERGVAPVSGPAADVLPAARAAAALTVVVLRPPGPHDRGHKKGKSR